MAATFAARIQREFRWGAIEDAIDAVIEAARDRIAAGGIDADPLAEVKHGGVVAFASRADDFAGEDGIVASVFVGRVMDLTPSGSFYAPWTPMPAKVVDRDARYWEAFDKVASLHGLVATNGEGDPTDVFVERHVPIEDPRPVRFVITKPDGTFVKTEDLTLTEAEIEYESGPSGRYATAGLIVDNVEYLDGKEPA